MHRAVEDVTDPLRIEATVTRSANRRMVARNKHSRPRAVGGGRSKRYESRKARRSAGAEGRGYAPEWSDAAAEAVMRVLTSRSAGPRKISAYCDTWLPVADCDSGFLRELRLSPSDRDLAAGILAFHSAKAQACDDAQDLRKAVKTFLKPLRERKEARTEVEELSVTPAADGPESFHAWLSPQVSRDRLRDISTCYRILSGIRAWPLQWLRKRGVVCYERAAGRIDQERGGRPDAQFMKGVVKLTELATATGNASDHYVLLTPNKEPRFLSVQEVLRSCGVQPRGGLWRQLTSSSCTLSAPEAVSCLGRSVHTGVARQLILTLMEEGRLQEGATYGSAFSGIDTFAAGMEEVMGKNWEYTFASEKNEKIRDALLGAWGACGLTEEACFADSMGPDAKAAPTVDLYVTTPECNEHSKRNHKRSADRQRVSLSDFWDSLEYVRAQRPRLVIVENVSEPSAVGPMTGLLARIQGYEMRTGMLDPRAVARMPVARERQFWVLYKL